MAKIAVMVLLFILCTQLSCCQQSITLTLDIPQVSSQPGGTETETNSAKPKMQVTSQRVIGRVGQVISRSAPIRSSRSLRSRILFECKQGTYLGIVNESDGYLGVLMSDGRTGWIKSESVRILDYNIVRSNTNQQRSPSNGNSIIQTALQYLDIPYAWGGYSSGGLDCSGFVKAVFASFGINLPRCSREQVNVGQVVPIDQIQVGDRLYFACKGGDIDHTGIYMGNGYFIHASSSRGKVAVDKLDTPKYLKSLVAIRR